MAKNCSKCVYLSKTGGSCLFVTGKKNFVGTPAQMKMSDPNFKNKAGTCPDYRRTGWFMKTLKKIVGA